VRYYRLRAKPQGTPRKAAETTLLAAPYLEGADLQKANLRGADLTEEAIGDATTKLQGGLQLPASWKEHRRATGYG
jgi:hypothetical protein